MTKGPSSNQPKLEFVIWNLELGSIKLYLSCIIAIIYVSESSRNDFSKVIKVVLDYAISNTGIESLSVEVPETTKIPNIITKAIEHYRQCALSKGHLYHVQ